MKKENREVFQAFGLLTQIGITLLTTVFLSIFIGYKMDEKFGTSFWFPIWLILGLLAGIQNIYGLVKRFYIKDKEKEDKELEYFENLKCKVSAKDEGKSDKKQ
ncbi:AtpZ/AtpI family protein [Anaerosporobacter sp.]